MHIVSLSPHTLLFENWEMGTLLHSLLHFHVLVFFFLLLKIALLTFMRSSCCGPQVLALLSGTEFAFPIMLLLLNMAGFWPGLQEPLTLSKRGTIASMLDHWISTMCLSSFCFTAYQLVIYHLSLFLVVNFVANNSALVGFYLWFFCLFVSSSLLFSALTGRSGSTHYVFLSFLSPSPPVLSSRWLLSAIFSFDVFALLLF